MSYIYISIYFNITKQIFYFCKNDKTAALLTLAILLIFSEKESSKIGECFKSLFLKAKYEYLTLPAISENYTSNMKIRNISIMNMHS